jgi:glycosyltransferase involved in cell wall biosynthesis
LSRARNTGIEAARGEWIAFLDDDDLWSPQKLAVQLSRVRAEAASFVYGASVMLDEHLHVVQEHHPTDPAALAGRLRTQYSIPAGCSNVMVKAELMRRLGGFDENLWHLQDWDMWLRLAAEAPGAACREILVGYVVHGENSFLGDPAHDMMDDLRYLLRKHGSGAHGLDVDGASFGRWVAFRLRRAGKRRRAARLYLRSARAHRDLRDVLLAGYSLVDGRIADLARAALLGRARSVAAEQPMREPAWLAHYR